MVASPILAPEEDIAVVKKIRKVYVPTPKPVGRNERVREMLFEIFEGHEDFLGWTPD
jgi:hypothetical protein